MTPNQYARILCAVVISSLFPTYASAAVYGPATSSGAYTISWDPVTGSTYVTIHYYTVIETYSGTSTNHTVDGTSINFTRTNNGIYQYDVYVEKESCNRFTYECYWTTQSIGTVSVDVTVTPPGVPGSIGLAASSASGDYTVSWTASSGVVDTYVLQERKDSGSWATVQNSSALSRAFSDKAEGDYSYRAKACNDTGCSTFNGAKTIKVRFIPGIPGPIAAPDNNTSGSFDVSWDVATGIVESYQLQQKRNSGTWANIATVGPEPDYSTPPYPFSVPISLQEDGEYFYRVRACNISGCGNYNVPKAVSVGIVPDPPSSVSLPPTSSDGSYQLAWQASGLADHYEVAEKFNTKNWTPFASVGSTLFVDYSNKPNGTYRYQVRACNVSGCSGSVIPNSVVVDLTPGKTVRFVHTDLLGSPVVESDEAGETK